MIKVDCIDAEILKVTKQFKIVREQDIFPSPYQQCRVSQTKLAEVG